MADDTMHPLMHLDEVGAHADRHAHLWRDRDDTYWLQRLVQEVGELASSLAGDHEHAPEHELVQIGSIATNWLRLRRERRDA